MSTVETIIIKICYSNLVFRFYSQHINLNKKNLNNVIFIVCDKPFKYEQRKEDVYFFVIKIII